MVILPKREWVCKMYQLLRRERIDRLLRDVIIRITLSWDNVIQMMRYVRHESIDTFFK
jgi:hypothetical protein